MKVKAPKKATAMAEAGGEVQLPAAVDGEKVEEGGKTVVVGVRMDAQSRELLTWALVKVAQSGDRVVALHVLPNSAAVVEAADGSGGNSPSSMIALVKAFESVLAVYEGFCNLKQVDLKLKVCRGSSLRKVLVREATAFNAAHLILGVAKHNHGLGSSSISIAKYCAKKVTRECCVAAVSNGKIVFQREAAAPPSSHHSSPVKDGKRKAKNSKLLNGSNDNLFCLLPNKNDVSSRRFSSSDSLLEESCSICSSPSVAAPAEETAAASAAVSGELEAEGEPSVPVSVHVFDSVPGSPAHSVQEGQEGRLAPGVPKSVLHRRRPSFSERSKNVLQWAMRFQGRNLAAAAVHPDRKPSRFEKDAKQSLVGEKGDAVGNEEPLQLSKELESLHENYASVCRIFTYQELADATSDFSDENLIGKGGNSSVYKGFLPDGRQLAVKFLKQTEDVAKEFVLEIDIITKLHHKNIISLVGFCFDNNNLLLVYDLMSRGSLEENLHDISDSKMTLGWPERHKIAVGVAEALSYLHGSEDISEPVIHRDVKSSNILLSEDFDPQLSDFGFATWASSCLSPVTSNDVAGTFGYLAPEYFLFGKVNEKTDVYAFGVVLLELLTGKKPIGKEYPKGQENLVMWAKPVLQSEEAKELLDPRLDGTFDNDQVERMILAASLCTRRAPKLRPKMSVVLNLLQGDDEAIKSARSQVKASEEIEGLDEETAYPVMNDIQSHLSLALLDVEDGELSLSSASHSIGCINSSVEAYLQGRWSRSSSFD